MLDRRTQPAARSNTPLAVHSLRPSGAHRLVGGAALSAWRRAKPIWLVLALVAASNLLLVIKLVASFPAPSCSHSAPCGHQRHQADRFDR